MHKLLPVLCAAALVGALFWLLARERTGRPPRASSPVVAPAEAAAAELAAPAASVGAPMETGARAALRPEAPPMPGDARSAVPARSRVFGLVTDQRGAPIEGAQATLHGTDRWVGEDAHSGEVPLIYSAATGRDGRFAFDVLTPSSDWVSLLVEGGIYRGRAGRNFGLAGGRNQDPLRVGNNDLGTFVLEDAGAVTGRVTDAAGAPLAGVTIMLEGVCSDGFNRWAETDERGDYELGGLPAYRLSLEASRERFLSLRRSGIDVRPGQTTPGVDFTLAAAPSISGRVVGEDGAPLAGVWLSGSPASGSGRGAGGSSGEDGTFVVDLPQDEPYALGAELAGYEELSGHGPPVYAPGTRTSSSSSSSIACTPFACATRSRVRPSSASE